MKPIIEIKDLSKKFKLYPRNQDRVKEWLLLSAKKFHQDFWALQDINFRLNKGETLGVIGHNGSGKSTLLQVLCGIMAPTKGSVATSGKISALLELGTGFDPELTGRENLFLSGSIQGLDKKTILERIPLIEEFANIGEFIDQPVKFYSSGMYVRLAFSAAIHVDPEILVVDEALAVGDVKFQNKCYRKFQQLKEEGKTIIFVTHSTDLITKHCDRAILLDHGKLVLNDKPNLVVNRFFELMFGDSTTEKPSEPSENPKPGKVIQTRVDPELSDGLSPLVKSFVEDTPVEDLCPKNPLYNPNEHRYGNRKAEVVDFLVLAEEQVNPPRVFTQDVIKIYIKYRFSETIQRPVYGVTFKTLDGVEIFALNNISTKQLFTSKHSGEFTIVEFEFKNSLNSGEFFINVGLSEMDAAGVEPLDRRYDLIHLRVENRNNCFGFTDFEMKIKELTQS